MADEEGQNNGALQSLFSIEHALDLIAYSYVFFSAPLLYEDEAMKFYAETIERCHIYFIGYLPIIKVQSAEQHGQNISIHFDCHGEQKEITYAFPEGCHLKNIDGELCVERPDGNRYWLRNNVHALIGELAKQGDPQEFDVRYIGQSYGKEGSRSALDRLRSHEKLQKIALQKKAPSGYEIALLLVEIHPGTSVITAFKPNAVERDFDESRFQAGIDKLYGTSEAERVSLYEASMIRYFQPEFNKDYVDSFPSTNLKVLQDCYDKDFSEVIAEFCFDGVPFFLRSEAISASQYHIVRHNLHSDDERRAFFSL